MQPIDRSSGSPSFPHVVPGSTNNFPDFPDSSSSSPVPAAQPPPVWARKKPGDDHLARKEVDVAIGCYTKALQSAEEQQHHAGIAESLQD